MAEEHQSAPGKPAIEEVVIHEANAEFQQQELQLFELELQEKSEFLSFRRQWSKYLLTLVIFIVIFNALFLIAIGINWLSFEDEWLVRIIITGSFIEVLGLAKIVVDFLFPTSSPHSLRS